MKNSSSGKLKNSKNYNLQILIFDISFAIIPLKNNVEIEKAKLTVR
jgi:hypothetical protein